MPIPVHAEIIVYSMSYYTALGLYDTIPQLNLLKMNQSASQAGMYCVRAKKVDCLVSAIFSQCSLSRESMEELAYPPLM